MLNSSLPCFRVLFPKLTAIKRLTAAKNRSDKAIKRITIAKNQSDEAIKRLTIAKNLSDKPFNAGKKSKR